MRPPSPGCWTCSARPPRPAGRSAGPVRCWRSASCASTGGWAGGRLASSRIRRPVAARCTACWTGRSPRSCGCSASGARSTAPTASSPTAAPIWSGCGSRRPACAACWSARGSGCGRCPVPAGPSASRSRTGWSTGQGRSGSTTRPTSLALGWRRPWPGDLVSRKWLAEVVSAEETSTQVQVVFTQALEREGLLARVTARQDGLVDLTVDDPARPVLLALSDNGPQMTSGSTREFMALCAIHQHFGRPGTPTDQAWTWVAVRPRQGRMAPPQPAPRPGDLARRTRGRAGALQRGAAARRDRLRHAQRRARGPRSSDPQGPRDRTGAGPPPAACLASRAPSV
jgi:hypothetical protein